LLFQALKKHPDTASVGVTNAAAEFSLISNAWAVLSKPDLKRQYDSARKSYISPTTYTTNTTTTEANIVVDHTDLNVDRTEINDNFHVQRAAYMKTKDPDVESWAGLRGKYHHEKWRKMPLEQKKVSFYCFQGQHFLICLISQLERARPLLRGNSVMIIAGVFIGSGIAAVCLGRVMYRHLNPELKR
jgi:curved DNA-binding protein CbpA